jgi:G:T/U-mismatch repair DNA glycosylase
MLHTKHQYLKLYPIQQDSEKLIVGTIHPHFHERFQIPFFYGNVMSLWKILNRAFPGEMSNPITKESVLAFLNFRKIAISDTIIECDRKNDTALDEDLIPTLLHFDLLNQITNSKVRDIYFTSAFGTNNAFKLFYVDLLKQKISTEIRIQKEVLLDNHFFGRQIKLHILFSPSGMANTGLSKSKLYLENKHKYKRSKRPVADFKIDYYRLQFEK